MTEKDLSKLSRLTGCTDELLLGDLYEDAQEFILSYTSRTTLPVQLEKAVRDLVVIAYNRMGTEGETGRSEGGENYSFDSAPKHIYDILNRYRLARVGGKTYEAKTKQG